MQTPVLPENILTSRIPGGCEVSTIRFNTGAYETRAFNGGEVIGDNSVGGYDWNLSDALRTHADTIDLLCGTDLDAKRNTVKVEPHNDEDEEPRDDDEPYERDEYGDGFGNRYAELPDYQG